MATITWIALVAFVAVANAVPYYHPYPPMENPNLYQGDILLDKEDRSAVPNKRQLWKNATVPYEIDDSLTLFTAVIRDAMDHIESSTCMKFVPREMRRHRHYINIFSGQGCYSGLGFMGRGDQDLSLNKYGCMIKGTIIHELLHAIGFDHEQNRSDRDDYITINWENILKGAESQFQKYEPWENKLLTPFDYTSIMIYGEYSFSKDKKNLRTMVPKKPGVRLDDPIQKNSLSSDDVKRINMLYECPER